MTVSSAVAVDRNAVAAQESVFARLGDLLGRLGRKAAGRREEDETATPPSAAQFSASAVGIISNYGDQYFSLELYKRLRSTGIQKIVYSGPLATIDDPRPLWDLIQRGQILWVYGQADVPKSAPEMGELSAGPGELEVNGVLFRHFVPGAEPGSRRRYGDTQWPPPGHGRDEAVRAATKGMDGPLCVIGSGLEYERWMPDRARDRWELIEQHLPASLETPVVEVALPAEDRHLIVHPTSRGQYCSVIDPVQHRMVLFLL